MKTLANFLALFVAMISGLAIAGTLASSPNATSELGLPTISFGVQTKERGEGPTLLAWPQETLTEASPTHESLPLKRTIGLVVAKRVVDDTTKAELIKLIEQRHHQTKPAQEWTVPLLAELRQTPVVQFAWMDTLPMQDNVLNLASCQQQVRDTQAKIVQTKAQLKAYEIETAVLTDQLQKQWAERLLRQSTEDMQTLTLMRARSEQDVRLRLARSGFDDARIRMEGLSSVEQVRLAYLTRLNQLLSDKPAATLLPILEKYSVFTKPDTKANVAPSKPKQGNPKASPSE